MIASGWTPAAAVAALEVGGERPALLVMADGAAEPVSSRDLAGRIYGAARALAAAGVRRGDTVAVQGANGPDWIAAGLACGWLGAVLAPLDALTEPAEATRIATAVGARVLMSDAAERPPDDALARLPLSVPPAA